jgi:hypothetical protein
MDGRWNVIEKKQERREEREEEDEGEKQFCQGAMVCSKYLRRGVSGGETLAGSLPRLRSTMID